MIARIDVGFSPCGDIATLIRMHPFTKLFFMHNARPVVMQWGFSFERGESWRVWTGPMPNCLNRELCLRKPLQPVVFRVQLQVCPSPASPGTAGPIASSSRTGWWKPSSFQPSAGLFTSASPARNPAASGKTAPSTDNCTRRYPASGATSVEINAGRLHSLPGFGCKAAVGRPRPHSIRYPCRRMPPVVRSE